MIQAQDLPASASVYDYPTVMPGEELTPEQTTQLTTAQIAGIIIAVAAAKSGITAATTMQLVALLRGTNLASQAAVASFATFAEMVVSLAVRRSQEITWAGVSNRASLLGVEFPPYPPDDDEIPSRLRYSRGTDLKTAYERVGKEYEKNLQRGPQDPVIKELVRQFEEGGLSPLPRPDNISSDAIQRIADGRQEWKEAFLKAEKASKAESGKDAEATRLEPEVSANLTRGAGPSPWVDLDKEEFVGDDVPDARAQLATAEAERVEAERAAKPSTGSVDEEPEDDGVEEEPTFALTETEVREVVVRYAQHKAEERVERMVDQDVAGAARNMYGVAMSYLDKAKVVGYRRVVHPELAESGRSCGLCIVASTMQYTRAELLPIHAGCNCETCEIYSINGETYDPGKQINMEDLAVFYGEAGRSTHGWDLKKQRYEVVDHPEYGPTLVNVSEKRRTEEVEFGKRAQRGN